MTWDSGQGQTVEITCLVILDYIIDMGYVILVGKVTEGVDNFHIIFSYIVHSVLGFIKWSVIFCGR